MLIKWLLVIGVVLVVAWLLLGRRRGGSDADAPKRPRSKAGAAPMLSCAHCGVLLPSDEAVLDPSRRAFCSDAHRSAGPR